MARDSSVSLEQVQIVRPKVVINSADVHRVIRELKTKHTVWRLVEESAQLGNKLLLTLVQPLGDETIEVILGGQHKYSEVEELLIGRQCGEKLVLSNEQVSISGVFKAQPIENDSQLARLFGCEDEIHLYQHVELSMRQGLDKAIDNLVKRRVFGQVIAYFSDGEHASQPATEQELLEESVSNMLRQHPVSLDEKRVEAELRAVSKRTESKLSARIAKEDRNLYLKVSAAVMEAQIIEQILNNALLYDDAMSYQDFISTHPPQIIKPLVNLRREKKCKYCGERKCCNYVTQEIIKPRSKSDFEHLLWQVSHKNINIFQDKNRWFLIIEAQCEHLRDNGDCGIYVNRPKVCKNYKNSFCEFDYSGKDHYQQYFDNYQTLLDYCQRKFESWKKV